MSSPDRDGAQHALWGWLQAGERLPAPAELWWDSQAPHFARAAASGRARVPCSTSLTGEGARTCRFAA